jgi:hypothetical protein
MRVFKRIREIEGVKMKRQYEVPFMEKAGGFIFLMDWSEDREPTREDILSHFKRSTSEEDYQNWKDNLIWQ